MSKSINDQKIKALLKAGVASKVAVGSGLYFRVSKEGSGFWVFKYTFFSKRYEISIGRYPSLTLAQARLKAAENQRLLENGKNPKVEKDRGSDSKFQTVRDLALDWLDDCAKRLKHPQIPRRVYFKDIDPTIGSIPLNDINARDVRRVNSSIMNADVARPAIANDALSYMKQLFRHGIKLDLLLHNPAEAFRSSDAGGIEKSRSRILSLEELKLFFQAMDNHKLQFVHENLLAVKLLLLTGVRKSELLLAVWDELDFDKKIWVIPAERTKTSVSYSIPLTDTALNIFQELLVFARGSNYVFPSRRSSKRFGHVSPDTLNCALVTLQDQEDLNIGHFTVHDLRRTFRSCLAELKVPGHIAERCLNHKLRGIEGVYDQYDYFNERKQALETLERYMVKNVF